MGGYLVRRIPVLVGAAIGLILGLIFDNISIFVAVGAGVGLLFAIVMGFVGKKSTPH
ncbi:MAG: hypothetical protein JXB23_06045 [Candidatus Aminicenantes bacterium]|nr:hypothetical protein [Candidatus Aminicenantes bacterium]